MQIINQLFTHHNRLFYIAFRLKNPWAKRGGQTVPDDDDRCQRITKEMTGTRCKRRVDGGGWCEMYCWQHHGIVCGYNNYHPERSFEKQVVKASDALLPEDPAEWLALLDNPDD